MLSENILLKLLEDLKNPNIDILTKNKIAMIASETGDKRVLETLHNLIKDEKYKSQRGTFTYCLLEFDSILSFDLAFDLIINGNFEVAHNAYEIIENTDSVDGEQALKNFHKLKNYLNNIKDIEVWRKHLIDDVLEMFN